MRTHPTPAGEPPVLEVEVVAEPESGGLTPEELADLRRARMLLTTPGLAIRVASLVGAPIELGMRRLPRGASEIIQRATHAALQRALHLALSSLNPSARNRPNNRLHKVLVATSGALGGAFGLVALPVELPVSTTLILRSIAQIAASEGHDLTQVGVRVACLEVFALGGTSRSDDAADTSYWAVRAALSKVVTDAIGVLAGRGAAAETAPAAVRMLAAVASRFGVVVSEQVAAKAIPILSAAAGAAINVGFMDHFQKMARGHFIVRRLERRHGTDLVRRAFDSLGAQRMP